MAMFSFGRERPLIGEPFVRSSDPIRVGHGEDNENGAVVANLRSRRGSLPVVRWPGLGLPMGCRLLPVH